MEGLTRPTSIAVEECARSFQPVNFHLRTSKSDATWSLDVYGCGDSAKIARHVKKNTRRLFIAEWKTFLDAQCERVRFRRGLWCALTSSPTNGRTRFRFQHRSKWSGSSLKWAQPKCFRQRSWVALLPNKDMNQKLCGYGLSLSEEKVAWVGLTNGHIHCLSRKMSLAATSFWRRAFLARSFRTWHASTECVSGDWMTIRPDSPPLCGVHSAGCWPWRSCAGGWWWWWWWWWLPLCQDDPGGTMSLVTLPH